MTGRYDSDTCPACGSDESQPYAVIIGAAETYGYHCLTCAVTWPVLHTGTTTSPLAPVRSGREPAA